MREHLVGRLNGFTYFDPFSGGRIDILEWIEVLGIPGDGDDVWVPPGWTITMDMSSAKLNKVQIEGKLQFGAGYSELCCADDPHGMTLSARHIYILGGKLLAGNVMAPLTDRITIKLHGIDRKTPDGLNWFIGRSKSIWDAGTLALYGEERGLVAGMERLFYELSSADSISCRPKPRRYGRITPPVS